MNFLEKLSQVVSYPLFILNGKKPWSKGYLVYKRIEIANALARQDFDPKHLRPGYGYRLDERIIEYPWLVSRLPLGVGRLLDAGSVMNFDYILAQNVFEAKRLFISTLAPEANCFWKKGVSYIYEDLRETCYRDDYFNWIACLSTLEHIGMDNTLLYTTDASKKELQVDDHLRVIKEFRRILRPGGTVYLSFPFGEYRNHGWYQVFDAPRLDRIIETFAPASVTENHFKYEPDGWRASSREESKHATTFDIHARKTYDEDFAAASRAIVCLEMVK